MKLLISGYYGYGNLGDEALLAGLLSGLSARHQVTVLSGNPAATQTLHGVQAVHRYKGLLGALLKTDAVVSGGGGLLQDKTSSRSLRYYLGVIRLARVLGKRVVVYGQSIGPLSDQGKEQLRRALGDVPLAVRDKASQALLASLGLDAQLVADAALLLSPAAPQPEGADGPVLLIPRGGYPQINQNLTDLALELDRRGVPTAGMGIQPHEDDAPLQELRRHLPHLDMWHPVTPREALEQMTRARHVVSVRLHGLILAAVAHRGFSGMVYDPKVQAFLHEAGVPVHHAPADVALLADEVQANRFPAEGVGTLTRRAADGLVWLERVLNA